MFSFDPANMTWTLLSAAAKGTAPSPRYGHGFTSAGNTLYVHGGQDDTGNVMAVKILLVVVTV